MKHITVYGANGQVGRLVVKGLLERGHTVTAFVHKNNGLIQTDQLRIIEGDIHDAAAVEAALEATDAVISTLGSWHTPSKDILASGMQHIIPAMQSRGIKRIISLTGAESRAAGDKLSIIHRFAHIGIAIIARKILRDGEVHIKQLESSELDWTVIRSPIMNERGGSHYHLSDRRPLPWQTIHRQAVADALVQQLNDRHFTQKAPFINR
jgi:putative NADH-flavin reductase